jgi:hypothetical protein
VIIGGSIEIHESVIAVVGAQVSRMTIADIDLQSDDPGRKRHSGVHVARTDTYIANVFQLDH